MHMGFTDKIARVQKILQREQIDGWLIYDFRRSNSYGCSFLNIPDDQLLTRRFFFWIGKDGSIQKITHRIENPLSHLPGETLSYSSWEELGLHLSCVLRSAQRVAMEYSPDGAIPEISKVDAGTVDLVRKLGIEVVSSAAVLQEFAAIWDQPKLASHYYAAANLELIFEQVWELIRESIKKKLLITEYDIQQFVLKKYAEIGCITDCLPICAVNQNSADPHYIPSQKTAAPIKKEDIVMLDLGCKQNHSHAVYADLTKMAVVGKRATELQQKVFLAVKEARDKTLHFIREKYGRGETLRGFEIDDFCRESIKSAGYGNFFRHRTGHSIDEMEHGPGTHMDNLETHDWRKLLPNTCFSIEPGIYLPNEFGIRLECNVILHPSGQVEVTGGLQNAIIPILC
ncbi:Uncharacterized protein PHSC3_001701 [Chlamydiales bacterium STE3]|nr:Uncharacterized protein PHSC3_001701 [Chlamydiales bacterium STE3]